MRRWIISSYDSPFLPIIVNSACVSSLTVIVFTVHVLQLPMHSASVQTSPVHVHALDLHCAPVSRFDPKSTRRFASYTLDLFLWCSKKSNRHRFLLVLMIHTCYFTPTTLIYLIVLIVYVVYYHSCILNTTFVKNTPTNPQKSLL